MSSEVNCVLSRPNSRSELRRTGASFHQRLRRYHIRYDRKSNDRHIMLFYRCAKCPQGLARSSSARLSPSHETLSMQLDIVYFLQQARSHAISLELCRS